MKEDAAEKNRNREQDSRDPQGMAEAIRGILVAGSVLCNPLLVRAITQHGTASYINPPNPSFGTG